MNARRRLRAAEAAYDRAEEACMVAATHGDHAGWIRLERLRWLRGEEVRRASDVVDSAWIRHALADELADLRRLTEQHENARQLPGAD